MELLVVMAIMGILVAAATLSISSLRSTSITSAGNQLVEVFALARQNSISKNDFTAVVIQNSGNSACAAYCLLELPNQADGTRGTAWTELTPWKFLPNGLVFQSYTAPTGGGDFMAASLNGASPSLLPVSLPTSYPFQGGSIDLTSTTGVVVQCYKPDGSLIGSQALRLRLAKGIATSSGSVTYTGSTVSGNPVSYYDLYFLANTGATRIGRP